MIHARLLLLFVIAIPFLLGGCASKKPKRATRMDVTGGPPLAIDDPGPAIISRDTGYSSEQPLPADQVGEQVTGYQVDGTGPLVGNPASDGVPPAVTTIMFDFDSSDIRTDSMDILRIHSAYLLNKVDAHVILQGHGDERGTREYNLALGERRATAVKQFLVAQGVDPNRLHVFSYGEERPSDPGQDEAAWARNRRVEMVY